MRAILLSSIALLTFSALLPAQRDRRESRTPKEMKNFTFEDERFESKSVGKKMPYGIYLPKGYDDEANAKKTLPLVIWLHGMWEDHMRFHGRGGAIELDKAVTDGKLPPCIFVTANGGRSSMYVNREDEKWEDLISKDLLDHISANYRVSKNRNQRAIMGISMGGMGALRIAFKNPALFGAVGAHSSAVFAEDPENLPPRLKKYATRLGLDEVFGNPIKKEPWEKANPVCLANKCPLTDLKQLQIYFDAGSADRYGFADGNQLLHKCLEKRKVKHTWRLIKDGGHSWGNRFQHETLPHSFEFVGDMFKKAIAGPKTKPGKGEKAPK
ncbi:MAG: S-formylglutathione hydrolase [Planctomycetota bacterium]|jgi:S-formylglutathione hydrolase